MSVTEYVIPDAGSANPEAFPDPPPLPPAPPDPIPTASPGHHSPLRRALEKALAAARAWLAQLRAGQGSPTEIKQAEGTVLSLLQAMANLQETGRVDFGSLGRLYSDPALQESYVKGLRGLITSEQARLDKLAAEN